MLIRPNEPEEASEVPRRVSGSRNREITRVQRAIQSDNPTGNG